METTLAYVFLGALALSVMVTLGVWGFTRSNALLIACAAQTAALLALFIILSRVNKRTGWRGENTVYGLLRSERDDTLFWLYPYKRGKFIVAAYPKPEVKAFARDYASGKQTTFDYENAECAAWSKCTLPSLSKVTQKTFWIDEDTMAQIKAVDKLQAFTKTNVFLIEHE